MWHGTVVSTLGGHTLEVPGSISNQVWKYIFSSFFFFSSRLQEFINSSEQKAAFIYSPNYQFFMFGF
jgi:hypothetical protein